VRSKVKQSFQEQSKSRDVSFDEFTKELFLRFDTDGDGVVDADEFTAGLFMLGVKTSKDEVTLVLPLFDKDSDGVIDYKEFCDLVHRDDMSSNRRKSVFLPFLQRHSNLRTIALTTTQQRGKRIKERTETASTQKSKLLPRGLRRKRSCVKLYVAADCETILTAKISENKQLGRDAARSKAKSHVKTRRPVATRLPVAAANYSGVFR
jgi:hypothetical protein